MFVDASALTAMMTDEDDARDLLTRLERSRERVTSPLRSPCLTAPSQPAGLRNSN